MAARSFLICWANFGWFPDQVATRECLPMLFRDSAEDLDPSFSPDGSSRSVSR
jgi:hypothetical protein